MNQYKPHQPLMLGYNASAIKNWCPNSDPHAKYFRSRVPLAKRIPSFSKTQANPNLCTKPEVMNLSADYDKEKTGVRYDDTYCANLLTFWQYTDYYAAWHGLPVKNSPMDEPIYGVINLPNPAYTDAAHRNGVLSLGCWFWPREEEVFSDIVERLPDGSFPVADKMIEMATYFGFDGYFINQEETISESDAKNLMDMLIYMRDKAPEHFYLQWYDTILINGDLRYQNQFNHQNDPWLIDQSGKKINDSMFVNYAWNDERIQNSYEHAKSLQVDPFKSIFFSTENDKYGYNPPYDTRLAFPEGQKPRGSWALFGTDFVWNRYDNKFDSNDQSTVYQRERRYWTGPLEDPTDPVGRTLYKPYKDPFHSVDRENYRKWDGVAHYIPARSVIGSYPFVTRFNTGHGKQFFIDGQMTSDKEWYNAGIQDILPSWQWWIQRYDKSGQPINETRPVSERPLVPSFQYDTAYNGGSSLNIKGTLETEETTELRLFKTKLHVNEDVKLSLTYKSGLHAPKAHIEVGFIFEDDPTQFVWLPINQATANDWQTKHLSLRSYSGRTIATIGLRFYADSPTEFDVSVGELALTDQVSENVEQPTGFTIDKVYADKNEAELFLSWDLHADNVWYYDLYQVTEDKHNVWIGRIYDDVYYVKALQRYQKQDISTLQLIAVSESGQKSQASKTTFTWPNEA